LDKGQNGGRILEGVAFLITYYDLFSVCCIYMNKSSDIITRLQGRNYGSLRNILLL